MEVYKSRIFPDPRPGDNPKFSRSGFSQAQCLEDTHVLPDPERQKLSGTRVVRIHIAFLTRDAGIGTTRTRGILLKGRKPAFVFRRPDAQAANGFSIGYFD